MCGSTVLESVIELGDHPMCDDLVPVDDPRTAEHFPISILFCETCKTAHQAHQIPKRLLFPPTYHYRARHTRDVLAGMQQLVARVEEVSGPVTGKTVMDIGCNDGSLLSFFREKGAVTVGIDPTNAAADAKAAGHDVTQDYFTPQAAAQMVARVGHPDIVTFTNVFAHIENLTELLDGLRALLGPATILVIENHYLGSVLDRYQFDTFYHEHPRTYSLTSFRHVASALGMVLASVEFPQRYGGNIRVILGPRGAFDDATQNNASLPDEADFGARLHDMGRRIPVWAAGKRAEIAAAVEQHGPLTGKAFPGRSAILVKLLELDASMVQYVHEKPGSMKIGHKIPGTDIPIVSDDDIDWAAHGDAPILNLAWHIAAEIEGYLRNDGLTAPIMSIFSPEEFDRLSPSEP